MEETLADQIISISNNLLRAPKYKEFLTSLPSCQLSLIVKQLSEHQDQYISFELGNKSCPENPFNSILKVLFPGGNPEGNPEILKKAQELSGQMFKKPEKESSDNSCKKYED